MDYEKIVIDGNRRMSTDDLKALYETVVESNSKSVLEIGSMEGCSSVALGYAVKETGGHLTCIEPKVRERWRENIKKNELEKYVTMVQGESPWIEKTVILMPIDYLLIDGNHDTRWALIDYHYWIKFMSPEGIIAFHDYNLSTREGKEVMRAVNIILETDKLKEIRRTKNRGMIIFKRCI